MTDKEIGSERLYKEYSKIPGKKREEVYNAIFSEVHDKSGEQWILEPGVGVGKVTSLFLDFYKAKPHDRIRYIGIECNEKMIEIFNEDIEDKVNGKGWEYKSYENVHDFYRGLDNISKTESNVMVLIEGDFFHLEDGLQLKKGNRKFDSIILSFFINWLDRRWRKGIQRAGDMLRDKGKIVLVTGGGELFAFHRGSGEVIDLENWDDQKAELWKIQLELKNQLIQEGQGNFKQLTPSDPVPILEEFMLNGFNVDEKNYKRIKWDSPIIDDKVEERLEAILLKDPFKYFDENIDKDSAFKKVKNAVEALGKKFKEKNLTDIYGRIFYDIFLLAK